MTIELIIAAVIAALPTISAIAGIFVAACKIFSNNKSAITEISADFKGVKDDFQALKEEVAKTKEYESLKLQYDVVLSEFHTLLKAHRELLTKIDHIARKEEDYEGKPTN